MSSPSSSGEKYRTALYKVIHEWKFLLIVLFQKVTITQLRFYRRKYFDGCRKVFKLLCPTVCLKSGFKLIFKGFKIRLQVTACPFESSWQFCLGKVFPCEPAGFSALLQPALSVFCRGKFQFSRTYFLVSFLLVFWFVSKMLSCLLSVTA